MSDTPKNAPSPTSLPDPSPSASSGSPSNPPSTGTRSYKVTPGEGYLTIKLVGSLKADQVKPFAEEIQKLTERSDLSHVIVLCDELSEISPPWVRSLIQLQQKLKTLNKQIRLIQVSRDVIYFLQSQGVDKALPTKKTLREALVDFGLVTKRALDVDFINPFLAATIRVLQIQASVQSKPGKISVKSEKNKFLGDISGVIGLVSDSFNGAVVISFPEATFVNIMNKMLGTQHEKINKQIEDGAAELTNMVFGQAKIMLNEKGYGLKTAIPSVVTGENHSVQNLTQGPTVVVPFESDFGNFFIEICISG